MTEMTETERLLRNWDCPAAHCNPQTPYQGHYAPRVVREASAAINGYSEHDQALQGMWDARDATAVREWAARDVWDEVARETCDRDDDGSIDEDDVATYVDGVRDALEAMAGAIDSMGDDE